MHTNGMGVAAVLVSSAGLVTLAHAQRTVISVEASFDGGQTWVGSLSQAPGGRVQIRARVSLEGATAVGLAGLVMQPMVYPWRAADTALPFSFPGLSNEGDSTSETAYNGRHVRSEPLSNTGRMFPFGCIGQGADSSTGLLGAHLDPGGALRFAGSRAQSIQDEVWGVQIAQMPPVLLGTLFNGASSVVVFKYEVELQPEAHRQISFDIAGLYLDRVTWYQSSDGLDLLHTPVTILPIITFPAPGAVGLFGVVGVLAARRRR
jgi:hypothetical protein